MHCIYMNTRFVEHSTLIIKNGCYKYSEGRIRTQLVNAGIDQTTCIHHSRVELLRGTIQPGQQIKATRGEQNRSSEAKQVDGSLNHCFLALVEQTD